eukprot:1140348-Pelagomonas_calceolata.AAC.1
MQAAKLTQDKGGSGRHARAFTHCLTNSQDKSEPVPSHRLMGEVCKPPLLDCKQNANIQVKCKSASVDCKYA